MPKVINGYRGFTATAVKTRAEIPDQVDMSNSGNDVNCNDITMTKIKNGLGASTTVLSELCTHTNINHWSGYGPTVRTVVSQALVNSDPTSNYTMGSFAGYNHGAITPGWITSAPTSDLWIDAGSYPSFVADVYVGEVKWDEVGSGGVGVTHAVYNGSGNLVAWGSRNFVGSSVQNDVTSLTATMSTSTTGATYTGKIWIVDDTSDFDDSQIVCRLPNTSNYSRTVKVKQPSSVYYSSTGTQQPPSPWTNNNGALTMNWNTGYCTIGYDLETNNTYSNVRFTATLYNWLDTVIGSGDIFNAGYNPLDSVYGSIYLGMASIPAYGYKVVVDIAYS